MTAQEFSGKERDAETANSAMGDGLDYFGARYFSAAQGRFTTPDWSATPQPIPYADLSDPQTLNLYSYLRNNPLAKTDPDGHCCEEVILPILAAWAEGQIAQHPQASAYISGGVQIAVGGGLVATAAFGDAPGGAFGAAMVFNAALGGTVTAVNGTTTIAGAATHTDVSHATETLDAIQNVPGLVTTAATGESRDSTLNPPSPA